MATTEACPGARVVTGRIGDPKDGVRQPQPVILPDATTVFSHTAERLLALAGGHVMADWLRFMAQVVLAQREAVAAMAPIAAPAVESAVAEPAPPLAADAHRR